MSDFTSYARILNTGLPVLAFAVSHPVLMAAGTGSPLVQIHEDFTRDPHCTVNNLRPPPSTWPTG